MGVTIWLIVELHCERDGVYDNEGEYRVLEWLRGDEPPDLVLYPMLRDVSTYWLRFQSEFYAVAL